MGVNKVIFYGETLVDMSQVTVTPETLGKGETALDAKGDLITGTHECEETEPKLQSKTVSPSTSLQTVNPDSGYDGLSKVTVNAMPVATQATPSISVSSAGLITATATQSAGYVSAGTTSGTKQLTTQSAQTITPSTSDKTIASGRYLTGTQTIKGDSNLKAENIKSGVSIFGVAGSYEGSGGGGGGGSAVQIGTIELAANVTSGRVATVTLPFKPTCVSICKVSEGNLAVNVSMGTGASSFRYLANIINNAGVIYSTSVQKTATAATSPVRLTSVNTDTYGSIELLENGFAWDCITAVVAKGDWQYIAVSE